MYPPAAAVERESMSVSRRIHFNALPEPVRRRWVGLTSGQEQPGPLHAEPLPLGVASFGSLALLGLALLGLFSHPHAGALEKGGALQSPAWLLVYVVVWLMVVSGTLGLVRRSWRRKALPFAPGHYLFGLDLVDARGEVLELWPMSRCRDVKVIHQHINWLYRYTRITFLFEGAHKETVTIFDQNEAQRLLQQIGAIQRATSEAAGRLGQGRGGQKELETLFALDPFFEIRMNDAWDAVSREPPLAPGGDAAARPLPRHLAHLAPIALIASVVLSPFTWYTSNLRGDEVAWEQVQAMQSPLWVQLYLDQGGWHVEEARALLGKYAFSRASAQGTVTALRSFLEQYPDYEDARRAVHALYAQAMAAFTEQASTSDPRLVPFMKALVDYLERTESTSIDVCFSRPTAALLADLDERVAGEGGHRAIMVPVAPHFSEAAAELRERAILRSLQKGFGAVFPQDILSLACAASSGEDAAPRARPSIHLAYVIAPSGRVYSGERKRRAFIGIQVHFEVEMRVPGHSDVIAFELDVQPPSELVMEPSYMAFAGVPTSLQDPSDDLVYRVMAARAFDHLSQKLRDALFRADSDASRRAEEAL